MTQSSLSKSASGDRAMSHERSVFFLPLRSGDVLPDKKATTAAATATVVALLRDVAIPKGMYRGDGDLCTLCEQVGDGSLVCLGVPQDVQCLLLAQGTKTFLEKMPPALLEQRPDFQQQVQRQRQPDSSKGRLCGIFLIDFQAARQGEIAVLPQMLSPRGVYGRCTLRWTGVRRRLRRKSVSQEVNPAGISPGNSASHMAVDNVATAEIDAASVDAVSAAEVDGASVDAVSAVSCQHFLFAYIQGHAAAVACM